MEKKRENEMETVIICDSFLYNPLSRSSHYSSYGLKLTWCLGFKSYAADPNSNGSSGLRRALGFRVSGLGFRVSGLGLRALCLGLRA